MESNFLYGTLLAKDSDCTPGLLLHPLVPKQVFQESAL
jgi:hypothetical protein